MLPAEILDEVCSYLSNSKLRELRLVNRFFEKRATPYLFSTVRYSFTKESYKILDAVIANEYLRSLIKHVEVDFSDAILTTLKEDVYELFFPRFSPTPPDFQELAALVQKLKPLSSITFGIFEEQGLVFVRCLKGRNARFVPEYAPQALEVIKRHCEYLIEMVVCAFSFSEETAPLIRISTELPCFYVHDRLPAGTLGNSAAPVSEGHMQSQLFRKACTIEFLCRDNNDSTQLWEKEGTMQLDYPMTTVMGGFLEHIKEAENLQSLALTDMTVFQDFPLWGPSPSNAPKLWPQLKTLDLSWMIMSEEAFLRMLIRYKSTLRDVYVVNSICLDTTDFISNPDVYPLGWASILDRVQDLKATSEQPLFSLHLDRVYDFGYRTWAERTMAGLTIHNGISSMLYTYEIESEDLQAYLAGDPDVENPFHRAAEDFEKQELLFRYELQLCDAQRIHVRHLRECNPGLSIWSCVSNFPGFSYIFGERKRSEFSVEQTANILTEDEELERLGYNRALGLKDRFSEQMGDFLALNLQHRPVFQPTHMNDAPWLFFDARQPLRRQMFLEEVDEGKDQEEE